MKKSYRLIDIATEASISIMQAKKLRDGIGYTLSPRVAQIVAKYTGLPAINYIPPKLRDDLSGCINKSIPQFKSKCNKRT